MTREKQTNYEREKSSGRTTEILPEDMRSAAANLPEGVLQERYFVFNVLYGQFVKFVLVRLLGHRLLSTGPPNMSRNITPSSTSASFARPPLNG